MKSVASHPGAGIFRSTVVIILILFCIVAFLLVTEHLNRKIEAIAKDQVIVEIKQALSMMLYDYAIKGQLADLSKFDNENPFIPLSIYRGLPKNYRGAIDSKFQFTEPGWYFDLESRSAIYVYTDNNSTPEAFLMKFRFDDLNRDGLYSGNEVGYLEIINTSN